MLANALKKLESFNGGFEDPYLSIPFDILLLITSFGPSSFLESLCLHFCLSQMLYLATLSQDGSNLKSK